jgi:hypothetical protein
MDNHQQELADELARRNHLFHARSPSKLLATLEEALDSKTKPLEPFPREINDHNTAFDEYLRSAIQSMPAFKARPNQPLNTLVVLGSGRVQISPLQGLDIYILVSQRRTYGRDVSYVT